MPLQPDVPGREAWRQKQIIHFSHPDVTAHAIGHVSQRIASALPLEGHGKQRKPGSPDTELLAQFVQDLRQRIYN